MQMSGAQILIRLLEREGISILPGIPGGSNLPIYDALYGSSIRHILARHEQGAGFIAQGMARSTGKAAAVLATSGPGASNLITAVADARADSVPMVAITGQVPYAMVGTDAFQEIDTYGMSMGITKHNFLIRSAAEMLEVVPEAFRLAVSGRPGPVALDIPKDVQTEKIEVHDWPPASKKDAPPVPKAEDLEKAADWIKKSKKPFLYLGGGLISSEDSTAAASLIRKNSIPASCSLMALGAVPSSEPLYLGMTGMHGAAYANYAMEEADLIIAAGVRFDDRATGNTEGFCKKARIIHIDIDRSEIGKIVPADLAVVSDAGLFLKALEEILPPDNRKEWRSRIFLLKRLYPSQKPERRNHPLSVIKRISDILPEDAIITTDVGQHQMWTAQGFPFRFPRSFLTSGGLGTMGFGLPAAIGAALANPGRKTVCFSGDGSILMNIQELAVLAETRLDVTVIILNNGHLGLVRQQQELFYGNRRIASCFESNPDLAVIARGFGIPAMDLAKCSGPMQALEDAVAYVGPMLINVPILSEENVLPMVPPGKTNLEMILK